MTITALAGERHAPTHFHVDPAVDMKTPPMLQVQGMSATAFFSYGASVMMTTPPHIVDQPILARIRRIGIVPGETFDASGLTGDIAGALDKGAKDAAKLIQDKVPTLARVVNGCQLNTDTMGVYGTYYLKRACVTFFGLGANLPRSGANASCVYIGCSTRSGADREPPFRTAALLAATAYVVA